MDVGVGSQEGPITGRCIFTIQCNRNAAHEMRTLQVITATHTASVVRQPVRKMRPSFYMRVANSTRIESKLTPILESTE